jgi:hypothetical protein
MITSRNIIAIEAMIQQLAAVARAERKSRSDEGSKLILQLIEKLEAVLEKGHI